VFPFLDPQAVLVGDDVIDPFGLGIAIAVVARNLAQAMMIVILILQPMLFLSGAWNPPRGNDPWMRALSYASPIRCFIDFGYGVILKGSNLAIVLWDIVGIPVFGIVLMRSFSLWWFRRSLGALTRRATEGCRHSVLVTKAGLWFLRSSIGKHLDYRRTRNSVTRPRQ
jgi:hypothetical protein